MLLIISLSLFLTLLSSVQSADLLSQPEAEIGSPGGSLRLTCKANGFSIDGYSMYWIQKIPGQGLEWLLYYYSSSQNNYAPAIKDRFTAFKNTSNNIFGLDIKPLKVEDTAMYYCGVYYSNWAEWGQGTMVTVTAVMPSAPTLYGLVSSCQQDDTDRSMIYGCLAMDYIPDVTRVTWKKDGEKLTAGLKTYQSVRDKKGTYTLNSVLTLTESEMNCSKIYCEVQHIKSNKSIAMPCPTEDVPPTLLLTVSSREDITSSKYATVLCSIIGFHPESISVSWLKNGFPMDSSFFTSPVCEAYGKFSATSWLNISAVEWFHSAVYTCKVTHQGFTQSRSINAPQTAPSHSELECESGTCDCLDYTVKILPPPVEQVLLDSTVTLTCVVSKLGSGVLVTWTQGEETVKSEIADKPGDAPDSVTSTLVISTQAWLSGDYFDCSVNHQLLPTPVRDSIRKEKVTHLLEPSLSVLLPTSEEVSEQTVVSLTCLVRGFFPREIFIKWTTNNKPVNPSNYRNTKVLAENDNSSFFTYSLLSITAEEWASGTSYSCVVGHEAIPLKTISRTVDKSSGKPSFVNISLALMDTINSCR